MDIVYDKEYYDTQLGPVPCYPGEPTWEEHFETLADAIAELAPSSVIEFGCAFGMLVYHLRERGIKAHGYDISEYAIEHSKSLFCRIGDVREIPAEIAGKRFDLAVCIEVVEHLLPEDADKAIANLCSLAPAVLFSSTPDDTETESHQTVRPISMWDMVFARHGFEPVPEGVTKKIGPHARYYRR